MHHMTVRTVWTPSCLAAPMLVRGHGRSTTASGETSLTDPVVIADQMRNHGNGYAAVTISFVTHRDVHIT